jgi:hypothetical protein
MPGPQVYRNSQCTRLGGHIVVESDARYEVQAVAHARHVANVWEFHSSRLALARALSTGRVSGLPPWEEECAEVD